MEWSPSSLRVWDPVTKTFGAFKDLGAVKSAFGPDLVLAISRRNSFIRTTRLPDAAKADVARILALQIGTLFPVSPSEVATDFALADDKNAEGRLAVVAAVKSDVLRELLEQCDQAGVQPRAIVPAALGSSLLAKHLGHQECAIVEPVPEGLAIDIVHEGELRASRIAPMVPSELIDTEIARSFAIAKTPCADPVAAGGLAFAEAAFATDLPSLAMLSDTSLPMSFQLPEAVAKLQKAETRRMQRVVFFLWFAALILGVGLWDMRARSLADVRKEESKWTNKLAGLRKTLGQTETKSNELLTKKGVLELGFASKQRFADVAALLATFTPEGLWLTGINLEKGKEANVRGTAVRGEAVTEFLDLLTQQDRFREVKLVFANNGQIEKTPVVQFSISLHVIGNLPIDSKVLKK